jgi:hypothetical protein
LRGRGGAAKAKLASKKQISARAVFI